MGVNISKY